ncbi:MAG: AraC family transcriptional regulator [Comamonadaceae bacterium]|nr:MAG: AraC family transcriptional regulator [Comamonadaceae bacterium]
MVANRATPHENPGMPDKPSDRTRRQPAAATPMAFARVIAEAYRLHGKGPEAALELAQITPSQLMQADGHITAAQMEQLSGTAMHALDDEGLAAFSRKLPWGSYGMLARASLTSPNLGVAVKRWCRHHGLLTGDLQLTLDIVNTGGNAVATVAIEERTDLASHGEAAREFSLVHVLRNIHGLASWYIDSRIPLQGARFPFARPPHADAYRHMFPGPVAFDAARAEIRFDARYLAMPLRRDEKALQQMLQRALPLTVLQYRRDRLLVQQVRQALAAHPDKTHNAAELAALLNLSPRTLHRQLKEESASLQQIKDEVRRDRAMDLLHRTRRPLKQVAAAVGFLNEKSFIRAFQTWTGTSPAQFRMNAAAPGQPAPRAAETAP